MICQRNSLEYVQPAEHVVEVGKDQETEEDDHAHDLCSVEELLAGLAACDDLGQEEEHVTTIQGGDGEDVHEGEHDGDEGGH